MSTTIGAWVLCMRAPVVLLHWCFGVTLVPRSAKEQHLHRRPPTPRGAHTATYVPACFVGEAEYPEGCVVVFGGHTNNCSESLSTVDVLAIHNWSWTAARWIVGEAPVPRHGHTATLVEVDRQGYIVVVGGGQGNILDGRASQEFNDVAILSLSRWEWIGALSLNRGPLPLPVPGRHHLASMGLRGQILLLGGGSHPSNKVCVLDGPVCVRKALCGTASIDLPEVQVGHNDDAVPQIPSGRKMHGAACLLPWAPIYMFFGGWKTGPHFSDLWLFSLGGRASHLSLYASVADDGESSHGSEVGDDFGGGWPMAVQLVSPDGSVRVVRNPPEMLPLLVNNGLVQV